LANCPCGSNINSFCSQSFFNTFAVRLRGENNASATRVHPGTNEAAYRCYEKLVRLIELDKVLRLSRLAAIQARCKLLNGDESIIGLNRTAISLTVIYHFQKSLRSVSGYARLPFTLILLNAFIDITLVNN
jgi:hypothetical protein